MEVRSVFVRSSCLLLAVSTLFDSGMPSYSQTTDGRCEPWKSSRIKVGDQDHPFRDLLNAKLMTPNHTFGLRSRSHDMVGGFMMKKQIGRNGAA
eukprot:scaffold107028_cov15-Tisochrysis_lutea.AAC.2